MDAQYCLQITGAASCTKMIDLSDKRKDIIGVLKYMTGQWSHLIGSKANSLDVR